MQTKKVVLVKDEIPWVFVIDATEPWTIDPKIDPRNTVVDIPEQLYLDYQNTLELLNKVRDRFMRVWGKAQ